MVKYTAGHSKKTSDFRCLFTLVRAARIELASHAWKARILAIIRRPQKVGFCKVQFSLAARRRFALPQAAARYFRLTRSQLLKQLARGSALHELASHAPEGTYISHYTGRPQTWSIIPELFGNVSTGNGESLSRLKFAAKKAFGYLALDCPLDYPS